MEGVRRVSSREAGEDTGRAALSVRRLKGRHGAVRPAAQLSQGPACTSSGAGKAGQEAQRCIAMVPGACSEVRGGGVCYLWPWSRSGREYFIRSLAGGVALKKDGAVDCWVRSGMEPSCFNLLVNS